MRSKRRQAALRSVVVTCLAAGSTALLAAPAEAYCYSNNKWSTSSRDVYMATGTNGVPSGWGSAIQASGTAWNGVTGSTWNMSVKAWGTFGPPASGGWVYRASGDASLPGWTVSSATQGSSTMTWANVYLNSGWTFNGTMNQANKTADVRTVTTHEFGHWLRLLHPSNCGSMTTDETNAVMTPQYVIKHSLNADDRAASAAVY